MGIAAAFIGVAVEGWSVMKAPSANSTVKSYHAHLTKMRTKKILAALSIDRNTTKDISD